jgi:iron complex outermembrane receptor protein
MNQQEWIKILGGVLALGLWAPGVSPEENKTFLDLKFEELLDIEVSTAARKEQPLSRTAAAAYVITREDIRRSGATNIPEALRLAPGVNVAQISASKWSVSIRGFSGRFANKLLVLLDGRSLYNPGFSGVYWEINQPPLDDVERIEVIRGPGATLWGANAVNGIINIITRHASATQGGLGELQVGTEQQSGTLRWGGRANEQTYYRLYGTAKQENGFPRAAGGDLEDSYDREQAGFRSDWTSSATDQFTLQGDLIRLDQGQQLALPSVTTPPSYLVETTDRIGVTAGNLLGRWEHSLAVNSDLRVQVYWDYYERDEVTRRERVSTFDLDMQHHFSPVRDHDIVWGLGYRHAAETMGGKNEILFSDKDDTLLDTFSGFVQDEYTLLDNRLWLTFGTKIEHNDFTGWELQPSLRALWTPNADQSVWASVARAVRTPSIGERDYCVDTGVLSPYSAENPLPLPLNLWVIGSSGYGSERSIAYELGYRARLQRGLTLDAAVFFNDYSNLLTASTDNAVVVGSYLILPMTINNDMEGYSYGGELTLDWRPNEQWRVQPTLSLLKANYWYKSQGKEFTGDGTKLREESDPKVQFSLRTGWSPRADLDLDLWLRAVSDAHGAGLSSRIAGLPEVDGYLTLDARVAWRPSPRLELALAGKNLLQPSHLEYIEDIYPVVAEVPRSVVFSLRYQF